MIESLIFSFDRSLSATEFKTLADQTDWAHGRQDSDIVRSLQNCFAVLGVWDGDRIVGVARVISDGIYVAKILDVIVDGTYRGRGVGSEIMRRVLERCSHIEFVSLNCGSDQVGFYEKLGFKSGVRMSRRSSPLTSQ